MKRKKSPGCFFRRFFNFQPFREEGFFSFFHFLGGGSNFCKCTLNENEYTELLITTLSSLLYQVKNQEKVQEIIDENIETLYSLEDHENQIISERAKFIIDSQN